MPSYLHNRPAGSGDAPPRPHHHSQYANSGATSPSANAFNPFNQRTMGQQRPPTAPQGPPNNNAPGPFIPPPPGSTYRTSSFQCPRCQQHFDTRADMDRHSLSCGAAALFTGFFTPYAVDQTGYHHSPVPQPHGPSPFGNGGFQNQNRRRSA